MLRWLWPVLVFWLAGQASQSGVPAWDCPGACILQAVLERGGTEDTFTCEPPVLDRWDRVWVLSVDTYQVVVAPIPSRTYASPYYASVVLDEGLTVRWIIALRDGWGVHLSVHRLSAPTSSMPTCVMRPASPVAPEAVAAEVCEHMWDAYTPVMLMAERGEGSLVGSGVAVGHTLVTVGHVGEASPLRVWVWSGDDDGPNAWREANTWVRFTCGDGLCVAPWDGTLSGARLRFAGWRDGMWLVPSHIAEAPRRLRVESVMGGLVRIPWEDAHKYHIHEGASGSPMWWVRGGRARLVGVLAGVTAVHPVRGDVEVLYVYKRVCALDGAGG